MKLRYPVALLVFFVIIVIFVAAPQMQVVSDSFPNYSISGTVVSCTYDWFDSSTTITFSNQGSYTFHGNYNLQVGGNYTISYKQGFGGYEVTNISTD